MGPGRGSAAGSLVSYAMEITDIDPLEYGLLFERFLNPERISMPDIDIDFCTRGRGEVIQYVTEKYGREQVAQIITFGTLGARAAIKDVGRVLDMSFADVDRITKLIPTRRSTSSSKDARKMEPQLDELARKDPRVKEVLEVAMRLEGHGAQRRRARGGRGDFARAAAGAGSALQDQQRRNCHAVRHGRPGEARAAQDGFSGADHAHHHRRRAEADRAASRREAAIGGSAARRSRRPTRFFQQRLHQRRLPVRIARACATFCAAISPTGSKI